MDALRDLVHLGTVFHLPDQKMDLVKLTRHRGFLNDLYAEHPASRLILKNLLADRDNAVVHWTFESATGLHEAHSGMTIFAFSSRQIVESWSYFSREPSVPDPVMAAT